MFLQGRNTGFCPSKNWLQPPSWKEDTEVSKKKGQVVDAGFIASESSLFFFQLQEH